MNTIHSTTERIRQKLFKVSVQITVFTPPCSVYRKMRAMVTMTLNTNGMCNGSNTSICSVTQTTRKRTAAPSILLMKKNQAPLLWVLAPNRCSR